MTPRISGTTEIIAHLGLPTTGFRAPLIYNPYFASAGIDCVVVPMGCDAAGLPGLLRHLADLSNFRGALITMPHKRAVVDLLDDVSPAVTVSGACNAVRRGASGALIGDMFDGVGFRGALRHNGQRVEGASALVIGAGGVGSAIAATLAGDGLARLSLRDPDHAAREALITRLGRAFPAVDLSGPSEERWDIVVNASPIGSQPGDPLPLSVETLTAESIVGDVVLADGETPFLAAARAQGCKTQSGLEMLFQQIPAYLEFFGLPVAEAEVLRQTAAQDR